MILIFALGAALLFLLWNLYYEKRWDKCLGAQLKFERDYAYAGEESSLSIAIENRKRLPIPLLEAAFRVRRELAFVGVENTKTSDYTYKRDIFSMLGRQRITRRLPLACTKRGFYEIQEVNFTSYSLFHKKSYLAMRKVQTEFYVYARRVDVSELLIQCEKLSGANQCARRLYEDPFAFRGIRDYTSQDPMKTINWKATAKSGQMMVNTYDSTQMERVMVYLDVADTGILKQERLLEESISVAATLAQRLMGKGMEVGLAVNCRDEAGELFCLMPENGRTQRSRIEQRLARLTGKEPLAPFGEILKIRAEDAMAIYISKNSRTTAEELSGRAGLWVLPVAAQGGETEGAVCGPGLHLVRRKVAGA